MSLTQTDNGLEFCNSDLSNFFTNNDIKIIHGKPRHPQSQGACKLAIKKLKNLFIVNFLKMK